MCMAKWAFNMVDKNPVFQRMRAKMAQEAGQLTGGTEQRLPRQQPVMQERIAPTSSLRSMWLGTGGLATRSLLD